MSLHNKHTYSPLLYIRLHSSHSLSYNYRPLLTNIQNTHHHTYLSLAQTKEGAIGLELTGEIAGVFLTWWDRCMRERIEKDGMKLVM